MVKYVFNKTSPVLTPDLLGGVQSRAHWAAQKWSSEMWIFQRTKPGKLLCSKAPEHLHCSASTDLGQPAKAAHGKAQVLQGVMLQSPAEMWILGWWGCVPAGAHCGTQDRNPAALGCSREHQHWACALLIKPHTQPWKRQHEEVDGSELE